MAQNAEVRVRIAPSPTGDPHVGTAYIALFNYIFAKKSQGKFILRIEDTDQQRARASSDLAIMDSLRWLGLSWDEGPDKPGPYGPYRQSERTKIYQEHAKKLIDGGKAYYCFCTAERLDEMRKKQKEAGQTTGYDRHCRELPKAEVEANLSARKAAVVRLKMPTSGVTAFNDELRGKVEFENQRIDDQVLLKSDSFPTYHLANVVDDHLMKVTHVIRAEEWLSSTPKHEVLYDAFGWEKPKWVHMPLLRNNDKSKISKRKNPTSLLYYKRAGVLPEALLNFLSLMGWNPGGDVEIFTPKDMMEKFNLTDINLGGPVFDLVKLAWMNSEYLKKLDDKRFVKILRDDFFSEEYLLTLKPLVLERLQQFDEFFSKHTFFLRRAQLHWRGNLAKRDGETGFAARYERTCDAPR